MVARVSTTHCRGCIIGYVCIAYMNSLVGIALVVKELSLVFVEIFVMCTIFRTGYIYIYILVFCGDPFFHLRAHPTQMMG